MTALATRAAAVFAHPWAILLFPILCAAWLWAGFSELGLTLALSVFAITTTQLVLAAQDKDAKAVQIKLDAIIAGTDADDSVAGIERA